MPSTKKLTTYRTSQFAGPRRDKPPVRALNREIREVINAEHDLIQKLIHDAETRAAVWRRARTQLPPLAVWNDFDHTFPYTALRPQDLPEWHMVGDYLKIHLLFQVTLEFGGYSFTVKVRPDLEAKWINEGRDPIDRIKRTVWKQLKREGLNDLEYCYIIEGRSRHGHSRTPLHLHGFFIAEDPQIATSFKKVLERSIAAHPLGRSAAGIRPRAGPAIEIDRAYDVIDDSERGRGRWPRYLAKNATKWDARLVGRRVFMSTTATQTAREFWWLLREEPMSVQHQG